VDAREAASGLRRSVSRVQRLDEVHYGRVTSACIEDGAQHVLQPFQEEQLALGYHCPEAPWARTRRTPIVRRCTSGRRTSIRVKPCSCAMSCCCASRAPLKNRGGVLILSGSRRRRRRRWPRTLCWRQSPKFSTLENVSQNI
jgi:hypothetical protein